MPKPSEPRRRKGSRRFLSGIRTDTKLRRYISTEDGDILKQRADNSLYPKDTTVAVSIPIKRVLAVMRSVEEYDNFDEFLWSLIQKHDDFCFLPKSLVEPAKRDVKLKADSRTRAKAKMRYFPAEQRKPWDYAYIQKGIREMKENMANGYQKKRKRITSADVERFPREGRDRERRR